jgi:hypothetical protein
MNDIIAAGATLADTWPENHNAQIDYNIENAPAHVMRSEREE